MQPAWTPWVHPDVAARLLASPGPAAGRSWRATAVVLFVDVSGFTPLAEALGRLGPSGAEALTEALNALFTPLVARIEARGGRIVRFAGDAATVTFPCGDRPEEAARAALAAAADLQALAAVHGRLETAAGPFEVGLKCGLDVGEVLHVVVGADRLDLAVAGAPIDGAAEAEHHATRGEIVATAAVARLLGADAPEGTHATMRAPRAAAPPERSPLPGPPDAGVDEAASPPGSLTPRPAPRRDAPGPRAGGGADHPDGWRFLPAVIAERVRSGQARFLAEHRPVSVLFARLPLLPLEPGALGALLGRALDVLARFGATLDKVDCGDKGAKVIALVGAPLSRADDDDRAVACALALARDLGAGVGLHRGMAFCGPVGAPSRREYTAMGEVVNLAARLMQAAGPGEVLATPAALGGAARRYDATPLGARPVKGFAAPVEVVRVVGARRGRFEADDGGGLVGRGPELAAADAALAALAAGRGGALLWVGDGGIGKSRLGAELAARARRLGVSVHAGAADDRLSEVAFHAWRDALADRFGDAAGLEEALSAVGHAPTAPLLAAALGWGPSEPSLAPSDPPRAAVTEEGRRQAIGAALHALAERDDRPRLFLLDDAQWLDPASASLLARLVRHARRARWGLVVLARTGPGDPEVLPGVPRAELPPLSVAEVGALVARALAVEALEDGVAERVAAQSGGNPLHVAELVGYARARGLPVGAPDLHLPASLRALVASRVDALPEPDRLLLRAASVFGVAFAPDALAACFPEGGDRAAVDARLSALTERGLLARTPSGAAFAHRLTRQVVYEALSASARGELHGRLSDHLAATGADPWEVADHARRSGDPARRVARIPGAALRAEAAFAYDEAAEWWASLLPAVIPTDRDQVLVGVGRCRMFAGRWPEAIAALEEALGLSSTERDRRTELQVRMWLQDLHLRRGRPAEAEAHLLRAEALAAELGEPADRVWVANARTQWLLVAGRVDEAVAVGSAALALAEAQRHRLLPALLATWGTAVERRDPEAAVAALRRAVALAEAAGHPALAGRASGNLAIALRRLGRHEEAAAASARNLALAREAADVRGVSIAVGNEGVVRFLAGDLAGAAANLADHLAFLRDLDDARSRAIALSNLSSVLLLLGRDALAERSLAAGRAVFASVGLAAEGIGWETVGARLAERGGRLAEAEARFAAFAASGHPLSRDRGTTALAVLRVRARAGAAVSAPDGSAFAAWCAAPRDPARRAAALAEARAAWRPGDLESVLRFADLGAAPPPPAPWPLPEGVAPDPDLDARVADFAP